MSSPLGLRVDASDLPRGAAVVILNPLGLGFGRVLKRALPGARLHALAKGFADIESTDGRDEIDIWIDDLGIHLRELFTGGVAIVGVCASGILIRLLAPAIGTKDGDPPLVACAVDGSSAVPLLGGHHGANRLAQAAAAATGGVAAITTGGDLRYGLALDDPPRGWRVENRAAAKSVAREMLADRPVRLVVEAGDARWLTQSGAPFIRDGETGVAVVVSDRRAGTPTPGELRLRPPVLAIGVGCERGCTGEELIGLVEETLAGANLAQGSCAVVVSLDLKMDEDAVHGVAEKLGIAARFFTAERLEKETPRLANPSDVVFAEVGCHGVAEAAALAAVGPSGALVVTKRKSKRATVAIARAGGGAELDPETIGRARGRLSIVGLGPGPDAWRAPEARRALERAGDIVGYRLYLDLIAKEIAGKRMYSSDLSQEEARARKALDLAAEGRDVALVGSGDAGIYALASLVFELLDRENKPEWNRIELAGIPGISAFQAAGARIGAPFGHDFCLISLSDLLTPWTEIERRIAAAAAGDFVVAFYNPVSKRRTTQLTRAAATLRAVRGDETPVVIARNLGRAGETLTRTNLGRLRSADVDMLSLVVVGNSQTRRIERGGATWDYTPRGYAAKMNAAEEM
ncbi:precorrin-3B C(17)-methyltransferase [Varunaivibrio sulfuroxidans]|uniref:Cobalt-precorrin 5A hydrolase/precorrin-3B C17-methyltransferase n=1 Tax=Varunaivibrio sulfuroxidans TaxID=1773489 RepID=A0A4R3JIP6_9PROT|nr:precorrin-3B C(17)-methyltransferase [Varunaivibrio sulfuroxidans]TCS65156.1 cobalt-precorrin 5A hydrolase/precorrin-3B C17-methyltransferase [Varunaivibrio sulfuroxidans]WES29561.1 precorrin-3B C(17)-methyltransferase [Varunaivibrio sulfuroxidans]